MGGDDEAEDVAGGLEEVLKLSWTNEDPAVRVVIFVTDAPPHGKQFHAITVGDHYPKGDKFGLDPLAQVRTLASRKIDLTILKVRKVEIGRAHV